jgi:hypothetical protein
MPAYRSETAPAGNDVVVTLSIEAMTLSAARRKVRTLLADQSDILVEDAVQVADELVSNAYRHGQPPRVVRFVLDRDRCWLRIEVDDTAPEQPVLRAPDRTGGLGMLLVHRLASSWGVHRHERHKTVWAQLELVSRGTSGHAAHLAMVNQPR